MSGQSYPKCENLGWTSALPEKVLAFRHVASFQNQSASEATGIDNRGQISDFLPPAC